MYGYPLLGLALTMCVEVLPFSPNPAKGLNGNVKVEYLRYSPNDYLEKLPFFHF